MRPVAVLFLTGLALLSAAPDALALPTRREVSSARREIEGTLGSALRLRKAGKLPPERLSRMFLLLARGEENEARRLLLLQGAVVAGVEGAALDTAVEAMNRLRTDIPGMTDEILGQVVALALRKAKPEERERTGRLLRGETHPPANPGGEAPATSRPAPAS